MYRIGRQNQVGTRENPPTPPWLTCSLGRTSMRRLLLIFGFLLAGAGMRFAKRRGVREETKARAAKLVSRDFAIHSV